MGDNAAVAELAAMFGAHPIERRHAFTPPLDRLRDQLVPHRVGGAQSGCVRSNRLPGSSIRRNDPELCRRTGRLRAIWCAVAEESVTAAAMFGAHPMERHNAFTPPLDRLRDQRRLLHRIGGAQTGCDR